MAERWNANSRWTVGVAALSTDQPERFHTSSLLALDFVTARSTTAGPSTLAVGHDVKMAYWTARPGTFPPTANRPYDFSFLCRFLFSYLTSMTLNNSPSQVARLSDRLDCQPDRAHRRRRARRAQEVMALVPIYRLVDTCGRRVSSLHALLLYYSTYDRCDAMCARRTRKKVMILGVGPNALAGH